MAARVRRQSCCAECVRTERRNVRVAAPKRHSCCADPAKTSELVRQSAQTVLLAGCVVATALGCFHAQKERREGAEKSVVQDGAGTVTFRRTNSDVRRRNFDALHVGNRRPLIRSPLLATTVPSSDTERPTAP